MKQKKRELIILLAIGLIILESYCVMPNSIDSQLKYITESIEKDRIKHERKKMEQEKKYRNDEYIYRTTASISELIRIELLLRDILDINMEMNGIYKLLKDLGINNKFGRRQIIEKYIGQKQHKKSDIIWNNVGIDSAEVRKNSMSENLPIMFPSTPSIIYNECDNSQFRINEFNNLIYNSNDNFSGSIIFEIENNIDKNDNKIFVLKLVDHLGKEYPASVTRVPKNSDAMKQGISFFDDIPYDNYKLVMNVR